MYQRALVAAAGQGQQQAATNQPAGKFYACHAVEITRFALNAQTPAPHNRPPPT
jgi:hypothetical protein